MKSTKQLHRSTLLVTALSAVLLSGVVAPAHAADFISPGRSVSAQVETEAKAANDITRQRIAEMRATCSWLGDKVRPLKQGMGQNGQPYAMQDYKGGSVMVFFGDVNAVLRTPIRDAYLRAGGPQKLGFPAGPEFVRADGVSWQPFSPTRNAHRGLQYIYAHPRYGAHVVRVSSWAARGGLDGRLGYPKSGLVKIDPTKANSTLRQQFRGGSVYKTVSGHEWVVFNQ